MRLGDGVQGIEQGRQRVGAQQSCVIRSTQIDGNETGERSKVDERRKPVGGDAVRRRVELTADADADDALPTRPDLGKPRRECRRAGIVFVFRAWRYGAEFDKGKTGANCLGEAGAAAIRAGAEAQNMATCGPQHPGQNCGRWHGHAKARFSHCAPGNPP